MSEGLLGELQAKIGLDLKELRAKTVEAKREFAEIEASATSSSQRISGSLKLGAVVAGAAAIGIGTAAVHAASEEETAQARLTTAMKNNGVKFADFREEIEANAKSFNKVGLSSAQYVSALAKISNFVKEPKQAMEDLSVAQDISAATGKDLETSIQIVGLAATGNVLKLKQLGINLDLTAGNARSLAKANKGVEKAQDEMRAAIEKAGPAAKKAADDEKLAQDNLNKVQDQVNSGKLKGTAATDALIKAHARLTDAHDKVSKTSDAVMKAQDKLKEAQEKANKATDSGTIAIEALSSQYGGQASAKAETFAGKQEKLKAQTEDLAAKVGQRLIPMLLKLMDWIDVMVPRFLSGLDKLKFGWKVLHDDFKRGIAIIKDAWETFTGDLDRGAERIKSKLGSMWDGLKSGFETAVNAVIRGWNMFAAASSIKLGIPGVPDINIPQMKPVKFHQGGLVPGAPGTEMLALLQAGERVVPNSMVDRGTSPTIHTEIHIHGDVGSNEALDKIDQLLRQRDAQLVSTLRTNSGARRGR